MTKTPVPAPKAVAKPAVAAKPVATKPLPIINFGKEIAELAATFIGTREEGGANKGKNVEMFQKAVDGKAVQESWCMAFVQHCVLAIAKKHGTLPVLFKSEHCMTVWNKTPVKHRKIVPEVGMIVIWKKGMGPMGHTAIVSRVIDENSVETIEGNTGADAGVTREGDGVYRKIRALRPKGDMQIVGFLYPFDPMRKAPKTV